MTARRETTTMHSLDDAMPRDAMPRRGFLERLTALSAVIATLGAGGTPARAGAQGRGPGSGDPRTGSQPVPPDETWLRKLTGRHRTVLDVEAHRNGHALAQARSFLDAYAQAYGVPPREVNLVLGVRGSGLPLVLADGPWARYRLGEQYSITDPASGAAAIRNPFVTANVHASGPVAREQTVDALQRQGVLVLLCNNTVSGAARRLAAAGLGSADAIRRDILDGVLPGVVLVPAMVIAFSRLQEQGVSYVYAG